MAMSFFGLVIIAIAISGVFVFGPGFIAAVVAHRKGYRPWFWILSLGLVGMLVTLFMPGLVRATTPEQREQWESRADWTGGLLSGCTFLGMFVFPVVGVLFFARAVTLMGAPPAPPPPTTAPPSITIEEQMRDVEKMEAVPITEQPESDGKSE